MKNAMKTLMKTLVTLLVLVSAALNVFIFAGCRTLHDVVYGNPCKYSPAPVQPVNDGGKNELVRIAELLDIETSGKSVSTLSSDIYNTLDRSTEVPIAFDAAAFEKMAKDLNSAEEKSMREYQRFISELQGKKVFVIDREK